MLTSADGCNLPKAWLYEGRADIVNFAGVPQIGLQALKFHWERHRFRDAASLWEHLQQYGTAAYQSLQVEVQMMHFWCIEPLLNNSTLRVEIV